MLPAQIKELAPNSAYDSKAIARILKERGFLVGDEAKPTYVPTFEKRIRLWEVSNEVLNAE